MRRKNKYGITTAATCFYCDEEATTKNKHGLEVCKKCKDKTEVVCPIHNIPMDLGPGKKFGVYFQCYKCIGNGNWSAYRLIKWKKQ
jgi:hypothetical protein